MVIICDKPYSDDLTLDSSYIASQVSLSDFQKWAIKAIQEGDNVLVTAHTGSGKTLPAEFAIQYFTSMQPKRKVIYASPIKALSNQKLYDMRRKFPGITFGILTGDCKDNPEADVLIMTTEILRNTLLNQKINKTSEKTNALTKCNHDATRFACGCNSDTYISPLPLLFQMDFETELAAVVFDEVHYINDADRGSVWEQAILMLPPQVQLIMLSATIDRPEEFAGWIETEKNKQIKQSENKKTKQMYLASTYTRVVPLTHYMWLSIHEGTIKKASKTPYEKKLENLQKTPIPIATSDGTFREDNYYKVDDIKSYLYKNNIYTKRQFVLTDLLKYLKNKEMLPAICFIFSRKQVEQAAKEINFSLFEDDSILPSQVEHECRHILQSKLPNYKEYMELSEYTTIIELLKKGIAIHHAGIIPVLREMVELLFEKGFIRLLIATETFAVGLNMPTKTVIFTGLTKYNGSTMRQLFPHEYTQMAGRAGRRGLDTIGHVFHCVNLFEMPSVAEYRHMMTGPPQKLTSKFKISFNLALSMLDSEQDIVSFMDQSMLALDIQREIKGYQQKDNEIKEIIQKKTEALSYCQTPIDVLKKYKESAQLVTTLANSARKKVRIEMNSLEAAHKFLLKDLEKLNALDEENKRNDTNQKEMENTTHYIVDTIHDLNKILNDNGFISINENINEKEHSLRYTIHEKGRFALQLQEVHPLAMADLYYKMDKFESFDPAKLAGLFSCFYPVSVSDEFKSHKPYYIQDTIKQMDYYLNLYLKSEEDMLLFTGANYELSYDLLPYVIEWCDCNNEIECKQIIQKIKENTGVFLGEFVKALLKINAVALELERICEITFNMTLLEKLRKIPKLTLKYIATSQSLYL